MGSWGGSVKPVPARRLVADLMTEQFVSVRPRMRADAAAARMRRNQVRTAPVMTAEGRLVGVLSESDLARTGIAAPTGCSGAPSSGDATVSEVMRPFAITVPPTAEVAEAREVMDRHGLRWLVVEDARGHVVGVLSRSVVDAAGRDESV